MMRGAAMVLMPGVCNPRLGPLRRPTRRRRAGGAAVIAAVLAGMAVPIRAWDPQQAETYLNSAENRVQKGDLDGALADFTQAIQLDPTNVKAYFERGFVRLQKKDTKGAIADFTQVLTLDPRNAPALSFRGSLKLASHEDEAALADSWQAIALDPKIFLAYKTIYLACWDEASPDYLSTVAEKRARVISGLDAANHALLLMTDDVISLEYKDEFLRLEATFEPDSAKRSELLSQAEAITVRVAALRRDQPTVPPAPPLFPMPPATSEPIRAGKDVPEPLKIRDAPPVYPAIAVAARIQGVVTLDVVIDREGHVRDATITRPDPFDAFNASALSVVRQWAYAVTTVGGTPVEVVLSVTVYFTLK
jgi:TonB family protein